MKLQEYMKIQIEANYKNLINILQYLKGAKNKSIHYNKDNKYIGYSDSDLTNNEKTRRSTSGYLFLLGKSPISWKSQLQKKKRNFIYC